MRKILLLSLAFLLSSCLQGPWSYTPKVVKVDQGILVQAYIVGGRPITDVCFEPMISLDDVYTNAYAFFDSAMVEVEGDFGTGSESISLSQVADNPNCFIGDAAKFGVAGQDYNLEAVFWWDSSGTKVRSVMNGTAKIPTSFSVGTNAWANSMAFITDVNAQSSDGLLSLFEGLPEEVSEFFITKYATDFAQVGNDEKAQQVWLADNGAQVNVELDSLLAIYEEYVQYAENDTVSYLSGSLNTTSHYYKMNASEDVGGILVTQKLDPNHRTPKTRFDEIAERFGKLTPDGFYSASEVRRLIYYSRFSGTDYDIFDSLPVVNTWFASDRNVLYFYASDSSYNDYVNTTIQEENNSKVKKADFIEGGNGFFTGMLVDSFVVNIRIPENVLQYSRLQAHAAYCNAEANWSGADCWEFEREYCAEVGYNDRDYSSKNPKLFDNTINYSNCISVLVEDALNDGQDEMFKVDSVFPNSEVPFTTRKNDKEPSQDSIVALTPEEIEESKLVGLQKFCFENDFVDSKCSELKSTCVFESGVETVDSECIEAFYGYCQDNLWRSESCGWGQYLYCKQSNINSEVLCGEVNNSYCLENPNDEICNSES